MGFLRNFRWRRMADRHGPRRLTAIDLGDDEIRLLSAERVGDGLRYTDAKLIAHDVETNLFDNRDFCDALADLSRNTPYLSVVYGGKDTLIRLMNFPGQPGRPEHLTAQVRQTLGVDRDQMVLCRVVGQAEKQHAVLAASMPEEQVESLRREFEQRGFKPVSLVHRGIALANLAEKAKEVLDAGGNAGLLYADVSSSLLVLRMNGETVLIRQLKDGLDAIYESVMNTYGLDRPTAIKLFNSGSFDISAQNSPAIANWLHQVELSLDFIERRMSGRIGKIFLCGNNLGANVLQSIFELEIKRPVEVLPKLPGFACPTKDGKLAEGQRPVTPFLMGACEAWRTTLAGGGAPDEI